MKMKTLQDLFADEIKDLYSAETQIVKALPKMAKAASSPELKQAFEEHLEQTKEHVERLEEVCEKLDLTPKGKKCKAMQGLLEEGSEIISEGGEPMVLDAALIAAAQRVEHYEIAGYGCARVAVIAEAQFIADRRRKRVELRNRNQHLPNRPR